jgi:hypothetical protein
MFKKRCGEFVQGLITGGALASEDKGAFLGLCSRHKVVLQIGLLLCTSVFFHHCLFACVLFLSVLFFTVLLYMYKYISRT